MVTACYETPSGAIWIVTNKQINGYACGLVKLFDEFEWGTIEVEELEESSRDKKTPLLRRPQKIFKDFLPCTLIHLYQETAVGTYFA